MEISRTPTLLAPSGPRAQATRPLQKPAWVGQRKAAACRSWLRPACQAETSWISGHMITCDLVAHERLPRRHRLRARGPGASARRRGVVCGPTVLGKPREVRHSAVPFPSLPLEEFLGLGQDQDVRAALRLVSWRTGNSAVSIRVWMCRRFSLASGHWKDRRDLLVRNSRSVSQRSQSQPEGQGIDQSSSSRRGRAMIPPSRSAPSRASMSRPEARCLCRGSAADARSAGIRQASTLSSWSRRASRIASRSAVSLRRRRWLRAGGRVRRVVWSYGKA